MGENSCIQKSIINYGCKDNVMHFTVKCRFLIHIGLQIQPAHLLLIVFQMLICYVQLLIEDQGPRQ